MFKNKKLIALTFDDGPNYKNTEKLIEGLNKRNARATFFILGSKIKHNKKVILKAYTYGNQIGNHSYNHRNLRILDDYSLINEIKKNK
ncbi:MAG TPA: polysaccharide deacetylase family protein [Tenericutes bacterium]|nr:polysaccharide deacetylase family protein [Mycoplasmatota bacterium]